MYDEDAPSVLGEDAFAAFDGATSDDKPASDAGFAGAALAVVLASICLISARSLPFSFSNASKRLRIASLTSSARACSEFRQAISATTPTPIRDFAFKLIDILPDTRTWWIGNSNFEAATHL